MPTLYLVRHGRAAGSWDTDIDPGLDAQGRQQAQTMAQVLSPQGPLALVVSPMARTRETAAPLAAAWNAEARVEPRISEIPSPMTDLAARGTWLREIAGRTWPEQDQALQQWRAALLAALTEAEEDTVFVTHFMVINAAVSAAVGDDRMVGFRPDYCSITVLRNEGGRLSLLQRGAEGETRVL